MENPYRRRVFRHLSAAVLALVLLAAACSDDDAATTTTTAAPSPDGPSLTAPFFTTDHGGPAGPFDTVTLHIPVTGLTAGSSLDIEVAGLGQVVSTTESVAAGTDQVDVTVPFSPGGEGWPGGETTFTVAVTASHPEVGTTALQGEATLVVDLTEVAGVVVGPSGAYRLRFPESWQVSLDTGFPTSVVSNTESGLPSYRPQLETLVFLSQLVPTDVPGVGVSVVTEGAVLTAPDLVTWVELQLEGFVGRGGTIAETSTVEMAHGPAVVATGEIDGGLLLVLATRSGPRLYLVELIAAPGTPDAVLDEATAIVNGVAFFPSREPEPGPMAEVRTFDFAVSSEAGPALDLGFAVPATWGPEEVLELEDGRVGIAVASPPGNDALIVLAEHTGHDPPTLEAFAAAYLSDLAPGEELSRSTTAVAGAEAIVVVWQRDGRTRHDHFVVTGSWAVRIQVDVPAGAERADLVAGIVERIAVVDASGEG